MKVGELKEILESCDDEMEVYVVNKNEFYGLAPIESVQRSNFLELVLEESAYVKIV